MELLDSLNQIHWLSVLVSAVAAFAIGGLWYSPALVGNAWQKLINLSDEEIKSANMPLIYGTTFVLNIIGALFLDLFIGSSSTWLSGLLSGLLVSIAWITTSFGINYLFGQKPFKLFLIDAGYFVVYFSVMGIILGVW
jgi:hypothetical protein